VVSDSLPAISILGIGAVTPVGRDLDVISNSLTPVLRYPEEPGFRASDPALRDTSETGVAGKPLRINDTDLTLDSALSAQLRRADRFTKMAVAAASDAWKSAKDSCKGIPPERIGLFFCSGFGPHCRGFKFLDGILDSGETASSPTDFSHSVHGAASAYISRLLDLRGPSLNTTDFEIGFEEAVRVAQCWLNEGACDRVLLGAVEELGTVFLSCASRMLEGNLSVSPSEGAVFLMLARADVPGIARLNADASVASADLVIVEDPVILPETAVTSPITARRTVSFTHALGHSASASAFNLLGGLLAMRTDPSIDTAATLRTSSDGREVTLLLER
jgi:hypothetical protein